jgi:hypothetical protein
LIGIAIEGNNGLETWDGITATEISGDAIFLRVQQTLYIFPDLMSDAEVLVFITNNPQYTSWWTDNIHPLESNGRFDSVESAIGAGLSDGDAFTLDNPDSVSHMAIIEIIV